MKAHELSTQARRDGLLALEDEIENHSQRSIFGLGLRLIVDGTDGALVREILCNMIDMQRDFAMQRIMRIQTDGILSVQTGENPRIQVLKMFSRISDSEYPEVMFLLKDTDIPKMIDPGWEAGTRFVRDSGRRFQFPDIVSLDNRSVQKVMRELDTLALAGSMIGESEEVQKRFFDNMSKRAAEMLKEDMELLKNDSQNDKTDAQDRVTCVVRHLIDCKEIPWKIPLTKGNDD